MTGKVTLNDMVIEILKSIGHEHDAGYPTSREKLYFKVKGEGYKIYTYYVMLNSAANTARLSIGTFSDFDFYEPDSVILFKSAALQIPMLSVLKDISERLSDMLTPKEHYY